MYPPLEDLAFALRREREEEIHRLCQRQLLKQPPKNWGSLVRRFFLRDSRGEAPNAIARGVVEAFNAGDLERSVAPQANGLYNEVGTQRRFNGKDEILLALRGWRTAMPDVIGTVNSALACGNTVVLEITWEGTQTGLLETPDGTIPASGKRQVTPSTWVFDFEGDRIKESRHYFDMVTFLSQIGAMPQQAS